VRLPVLALACLVTLAGCGPVRRPDGGVGLVLPPAPAPAFSAPDQDGKIRTLGELRGKPVVLFFYPKDGTPGCTREACAFRDAWSRIQQRGAVVVGVSRDSADEHRAFAQAHALPFSLLSDPDGAICAAYGVKSSLGMASRVTFVLDRAGNLFRTFPDVDPAAHVDEVLAALDAMPR
jgi:peroxiredoxin Q/BCP